MIKLTYKQLNDFNLTNALRKLASHQGFPIKTAYRIGRLQDKIQKEVKNAQTFYSDKIMKEYFQLDEKGNVQMDPGADEAGKPLIQEGKDEAFKKAYKEFLDLEVVIDRWKIPVTEIEKASLSGTEIVALEPILEGLEALLTEETDPTAVAS